MGTSASSSGPGGGVPLVPAWVPSAPIPPMPLNNIPSQIGVVGSGEVKPIKPIDAIKPTKSPQKKQQLQNKLAPSGRFAGARLNIRKFAKSGDSGVLKKALGNYVRKGIGGSSMGARRMAGTAHTAGALFGVLSALKDGQIKALDLGIDPKSLVGKTAKEIIDVIVEAVRPVDGSQDSEVSRQSIDAATSDLLNMYHNANLLSLEPEQVESLIEFYVSHDVCERIDMDLGNIIQSKAQNASMAVTRLEDMKKFIAADVHSAFVERRKQGMVLKRGQVTQLVNQILKDVFDIFEEYLK